MHIITLLLYSISRSFHLPFRDHFTPFHLPFHTISLFLCTISPLSVQPFHLPFHSISLLVKWPWTCGFPAWLSFLTLFPADLRLTCSIVRRLSASRAHVRGVHGWFCMQTLCEKSAYGLVHECRVRNTRKI